MPMVQTVSSHKTLTYITISFRLIAGLIVSVQPLPIAWDVVNIAVVLIDEHHNPVECI